MKALLASLIGAAIFSSAVSAQTINWPALPTKGFISGRPATPQDVATGNAAFSMSGQSLGAIPVAIPQYVFYNEKGKTRPAVLLQAEKGPYGMDMAAVRYLDGTQELVFEPNSAWENQAQ